MSGSALVLSSTPGSHPARSRQRPTATTRAAARASASAPLASSPARRSTTCVAVLRKLNDAGLVREHDAPRRGDPRRGRRARPSPRSTSEIIERLVAEKLKANVALKLTHLGLSFDEEVAYANVAAARRACRRARHVPPHRHGAVGVRRRDAPASTSGSATPATTTVGTVLQAYLYRTADDLERLLPRNPNLRIVKGAYLEPAVDRLSGQGRRVDRVYVELVERGLRRGRVHRRRDPRRGDHPAVFRRSPSARASPATGSSSRCSTACARAAALDRSRGLQGARGVPVRPRLVPVPHATGSRSARRTWASSCRNLVRR